MSDPRFDRLTPRERSCLKGVRDLKSSDLIARDLGIASGTVDSYIRDAVVKIGARDRRDAAMLFSQYMDRSTPEKLGGQSLGVADATARGPKDGQVETTEAALRLNDAVQDQWRQQAPSRNRPDLGSLARGILDGTRPDELTMMTRAMLTLLAAVAIGFCFFALSAGAGMLFGIADFLRWLAS